MLHSLVLCVASILCLLASKTIFASDLKIQIAACGNRYVWGVSGEASNPSAYNYIAPDKKNNIGVTSEHLDLSKLRKGNTNLVISGNAHMFATAVPELNTIRVWKKNGQMIKEFEIKEDRLVEFNLATKDLGLYTFVFANGTARLGFQTTQMSGPRFVELPGDDYLSLKFSHDSSEVVGLKKNGSVVMYQLDILQTEINSDDVMAMEVGEKSEKKAVRIAIPQIKSDLVIEQTARTRKGGFDQVSFSSTSHFILALSHNSASVLKVPTKNTDSSSELTIEHTFEYDFDSLGGITSSHQSEAISEASSYSAVEQNDISPRFSVLGSRNGHIIVVDAEGNNAFSKISKSAIVAVATNTKYPIIQAVDDEGCIFTILVEENKNFDEEGENLSLQIVGSSKQENILLHAPILGQRRGLL